VTAIDLRFCGFPRFMLVLHCFLVGCVESAFELRKPGRLPGRSSGDARERSLEEWKADAGRNRHRRLLASVQAGSYDDRSRWNRWLYHGLHSWNFPWLYRNRPAWDLLVLVFLLGGTSLSITGVALGFQLLRAKLLTRVATL
jgi:hypothetical protein